MTWEPWVFTTMQGVIAFLVINSRSMLPDSMTSERFARNGILRGGGFPKADAPADFQARLVAREKFAVRASAIAVAVAIVAVALSWTFGNVAFLVLFNAALIGRTVPLAILGARDALVAGPGVRVSRGRRVTLADFVPLWAVAAVLAVQAAAVGTTVVLAGGAPWSWWLLGVIAVLTAGSMTLATWVAAQPQAAASGTELLWADAVRREGVAALLGLGGLASMVAFAVAEFAPDPVRIGACVALVVAYLLLELGSMRRMRRRLWAPVGSADAHR